MLIRTKKLICLGAEQITLKDGTKKWKYTFLQPDLKFLVAYDDAGEYKNDAVDTEEWDETKAKKYTFVVKEWQGVQTERLLPKDKK